LTVDARGLKGFSSYSHCCVSTPAESIYVPRRLALFLHSWHYLGLNSTTAWILFIFATLGWGSWSAACCN